MTEIELGGVIVSALLDTGSEVSTVTESWFKQHFPMENLQHISWVTLRGANGLEIPYCGILELNVRLPGQTLENMIILVIKDLPTEAEKARKQSVPALIGMNILGK